MSQNFGENKKEDQDTIIRIGNLEDSVYHIITTQQDEIASLREELSKVNELAEANKRRQRKGFGQILFGFVAIFAVAAPLFTLRLTGEFSLGESKNKYEFHPLNPELLAKACSSSLGTGVLLLFFTGKKELVEEWLLTKSGIKYQK
jgi:hypothetical protein